jgi:hypothetical protein
LLHQPVLPEIAPITGPMYQLFVFFMITDPRTIVRGRRRQMAVAVIIAFVETLIRFASDQGWMLPTAFNVGPAFLALAIVGPIAKAIDLATGTPSSAGTVRPLRSTAGPEAPSQGYRPAGHTY